HDVGDVAIAIAVEPDAAGGQHAGEELSRAADEGLALLVLVLAGTLADDHEPRARTAHAEHDGRAALGQLAALAARQALLPGAVDVAGVREGLAGEGHVGEPERLVMAEGVGQAQQAVGQRLRRLGHAPWAPRRAPASPA